jgi:hypothetical protein
LNKPVCGLGTLRDMAQGRRGREWSLARLVSKYRRGRGLSLSFLSAFRITRTVKLHQGDKAQGKTLSMMGSLRVGIRGVARGSFRDPSLVHLRSCRAWRFLTLSLAPPPDHELTSFLPILPVSPLPPSQNMHQKLDWKRHRKCCYELDECWTIACCYSIHQT